MQLTCVFRGQGALGGLTLSDVISGLRDAASPLPAEPDVEAPFRQRRATHLLPADLDAGSCPGTSSILEDVPHCLILQVADDKSRW